ncbi:ABC transporter ATP-binding protein [Pseudorhodoferax sp. Leaf274]|uniref:ABC transporter ATP-binding protein n=1 Tax=Pseudorhodoferax sp. Leaf274 TaxID=1736318 RepID=UPI00070347AA|nr:ABC transporter ATP-binding protein [Pseudorhodoferax sp. Leaf274]KQP49823.1 ABC transporter ATP-binding protein [Pseudorhodoferax sp. Leaf274]
MNALMQVEGLTRRFGGLVAVNAVTLDLHVGEVHAVIGTNGAGKSTLINMLSGEIAASEGRITLDGEDITAKPQARRALSGVGRSYQRTTIFPEFTVHENCRLAAQAATPRPWALWQSARGCASSSGAADKALEATGLVALATRTAGTLSHGAKRQLEVAMCLATRPRVLLLDEPLAGMGAEETERMLALLERLKPAHAILLVEHDMDAVFRIAERITVMVNGAVIASGTPDTIRNDPQVRTAYLGEEQHA